ncbi:hypothetical protein [Streptomyces sp. NPDC087787]|uniref:hypothetical protein n=1 Tax=Streptomyces sp. NPDC087787 TaxID=3365803 RepID=UPI0037F5A73D
MDGGNTARKAATPPAVHSAPTASLRVSRFLRRQATMGSAKTRSSAASGSTSTSEPNARATPWMT